MSAAPDSPARDAPAAAPRAPADSTTLAGPGTPFAVLDHQRMIRNIARLRAHLAGLGVSHRPHLKTAKSIDVARLLFDGGVGPITVSTLAEAEAFADAGFTDILYAVGLAPDKLSRVLALHRRGVRLAVLVDSLTQAEAVVEAARDSGIVIPTFIEVDCDGHRGGVAATGDDLVEIGRCLSQTDRLAQADCLEGVMLHAGESYFAFTPQEMAAAAANERDVALTAAAALRSAGLPVGTVSIGSTPTAHAATDLSGITEVRAGNYVFFDLVMAGLDVCSLTDLALSVVVTVIGHQPERGRILTDGGWMALSRDRGTAGQPVDQGYGLVTDLAGRLIPDLLMTDASQEHGILSLRAGSSAPLPDLPVGTRLRILPNHACATAAQHSGYHVMNEADGPAGDTAAGPAVGDAAADPAASKSAATADPDIVAYWPRIHGW